MSSLARRSVRTTAAAAGIAAIGAGFAGHAFAAPALPAVPNLPGTGALGSAPGLGGGALTQLPVDPTEAVAVPGIFEFEMPGVSFGTATPVGSDPINPRGGSDTARSTPNRNAIEPTESNRREVRNGTTEDAASPASGLLGSLGGLPALPLAGPELPAAPALDGVLEADNQVNTPGVTPQELQENNRVGALPSMDSAAMIAGLAGRAASGETLTEGNAIG